MITLLSGEIVPGEGNLSYKGQQYLLPHSVKIESLPPQPRAIRETNSTDYVFPVLENVAFQKDFTPVDEQDFYELVSIENSWCQRYEGARKDARTNVLSLWAFINLIPMETLAVTNYAIPDYAQVDMVELRKLYPALHMLSDETLYCHYDQFQHSCRHLNNWEPMYDQGFAFYLIGLVADEKAHGHAAEVLGELVGHGMLTEMPFEEVSAWAKEAAHYDKALYNLAVRIADAMKFVHHDKKREQGRGPEVWVTGDIFRVGRKTNMAFVQK